jgi:TPP-dependent 2-oxoacid decarboxylase
VAGADAERSPLLVISCAPGLRESEQHPLLHHRIRAAPAVQDDLLQQGERWLTWLRGRQNPCVIGGVELARFRLQPLRLLILEREGWPLATSLSGKSLQSESHPQVLGIYEGSMGQPALRQRVESSDGLLVIGQPLNDLDIGVVTMAVDSTHVLQVDLEGGLRTAAERNENLDPLILLRIWVAVSRPESAPTPLVPPGPTPAPTFEPVPEAPVGVERLMAAVEAILPAADLRIRNNSPFLASSF